MSKVLFQWVDGGILRQFQLEKNTVQYRILMAVVDEVKQSLAEDTAVPAHTIPASSKEHEEQAESASPPPAVSPLPASVNLPSETPEDSRRGSETPTTIRTFRSDPTTADNLQGASCNNCEKTRRQPLYWIYVKGARSNNDILGIRFKCAVCKYYDLCEECEASGVHAHHVMLRIGVIVKGAIGWPSMKPLHNELKNFNAKLTPAQLNSSDGNQDKNVCDRCNVQLTGTRLKCTVCDDFDLCSACDRMNLHNHHVMMRFSKPVQNVSAWKDMQEYSKLHALLTAFHDRFISVKGTPLVKRFWSRKAISKTPRRSRRPQKHNREASLTAGTPKSPRISNSQAANQAAAASPPPVVPLKAETEGAVANETPMS